MRTRRITAYINRVRYGTEKGVMNRKYEMMYGEL